MGSHWEVGKLRSDVMGFALGKKSVCMGGGVLVSGLEAMSVEEGTPI